MPADFVIVAGDAQPVFAQQIIDSTGDAVDLAGASLALSLRSLTQAEPLTLTGTVSIPTPGSGIVQWQPDIADTADAAPGYYMGKWQVTWANGQLQSYPTDGYLWVEIQPNLLSTPGQYLVSLPDVKDYLNSYGFDRTHDAKILGYIQAATPIVENIVGPVITRTFHEWHDGGQFFIQLRRRPSSNLGTTPIINVLACDEFRGPIRYPLSIVADPTEATIYSVMLDPHIGTLYRRSTGGGVIPFGAGWTGSLPLAVHVVYQAGQASIPANIRLATLEAIRVDYQTTMPTGIGSRTLADTEALPGPGFGHLLSRVMGELVSPNRRHPAIA